MTVRGSDENWPVVFLIDELLGPGGTEVHLLFLAGRMVDLGHPVEIWTLDANEYVEVYESRGVRVRTFDLPGVFSPLVALSVARLSAALEQFAPRGPVIVQSYHTASDFLVALLARRHERVRAISSWRDMGIFRKPVHLLAQCTVADHIDRLLVVSEAVRVAASARTGLSPNRIEVIHNGVDLQRFRPARADERRKLRASLGISETEVMSLTVGTFHEFKGQDLVVRAAAALRAEGLPLRPVFAGTGPLLDEHRRLAGELDLDGAVFLDVREDIPELLRASDLFVLTSWSEGFSNAILEAMASGIPVVATTVGGNPEAVTRPCGALVPAGDLERLVSALRPYVNSADRRRKSGKAARARAESAFALDAMVERYRSVHRGLLRA